jgi:hypothetical protein
MSLATIELRKVDDTSTEVVYDVYTPDFSQNTQYELIATIRINKISFKYEFEKRNFWVDKKVVPPQTYELGAGDMKNALANQFKDHGYGAWTGRISSQVKRMRKSTSFPDKCP